MKTKRFAYGKVFQTDAVVVPVEDGDIEKIPFFTVQSGTGDDGGKEIAFTFAMEKTDVVYGLGESIRGINKRGHIYKSFCADDPCHTEDKNSLYGAHNFLLVDAKAQGKRFLVFFDTPEPVIFDIGYSDMDVLTVKTPADVDVYMVAAFDKDTGIAAREIGKLEDYVCEFRRIIGQSYVAPRWAFGFQQCRWSYASADAVRAVAKNYRDNDIPIDAIYLDIDYMDHYKDFTVDEEAFPNFKDFVQEMKEQHIRLVPIIDAGVKIEEGYDVYEEGVANGYFCKDEDGNDFVGAVWPGKVHFPDFLNPHAREWFGEKYSVLLDDGIEGFWNDMNEPAIFYSEKGITEAIDHAYSLRGENIDIHTFFGLKDKILGVANSMDDYRAFYHDTTQGKIRHDRLHNVYGYNMTRAAGETFEKIVPGKRILMFSRASYIGAHRYGGIWQGDNISWWSHILMSLKMLPSLNMCGFLYTGSDLGGFGGNATEDLVMRWAEFAIFNPLMRNHAAAGTRDQEFYRFKNIKDFKNIVDVRYGLVPYLYSEYMKAVLGNKMYARPLSFVYEEDDFAAQVEDQLIIGDEIMIAPVYTQNATGRYVYLPEPMMKVTMRGLSDVQLEKMDAGHAYVSVALNEVVFFIRNGRVIPIGESAPYVDAIDESKLKFIGYTEQEHTAYELYTDDGISKEYNCNSSVLKYYR